MFEKFYNKISRKVDNLMKKLLWQLSSVVKQDYLPNFLLSLVSGKGRTKHRFSNSKSQSLKYNIFQRLSIDKLEAQYEPQC